MLNINKPSGYTRVGRLVIGGLAVFIPLATAAPHTSLANSNVPAGVCNLMPGLQGRIESISNERGAQKLIQIERAGHTYVVDIGCFLIAGDTVKPGPGNSALVRLPDGTTTLAEFSRPITISSLNPPGYLASVIGAIRELVGSDGRNAKKAVNGTVGIRNFDDSPGPVALLGGGGTGEQLIARGRPLIIGWTGGTSPFQIQLVTDIKPVRKVANISADLSWVAIDIGDNLDGSYVVMISGNDGSYAISRLGVKSAADVPSAPELPASASNGEKELLATLWLLTKGPAEWRLQALSDLQKLAIEKHDLVAQAILDSKAQQVPIGSQ